MHRLPSIKTLRTVFADRAPEARRVLEMRRAELLEHPVGARLARDCYHPPTTTDLRMTVLNSLAGTHDVECIAMDHRSNGIGLVTYLNAGDTYKPTLVLWDGRYRVESWGDRLETLERAGWIGA
mgnify:CR=1 FL=1